MRSLEKQNESRPADRRLSRLRLYNAAAATTQAFHRSEKPRVSSPRKRGSRGKPPTLAAGVWIPAFAGMTSFSPG
jgi:hypothetical protein